MLKLRDGIVELYRKAATSVPPDVEEALKSAYASEESPLRKESLSAIIENIRSMRQSAQPVCQDIGVPVFSIKAPRGLSHIELKNTVREATVLATQKVPLKPNAIDILTDKNSGDNTGIGFPIIYLEETADDTLKIDLMLRAYGCENAEQTYRLPREELNASRDLEGVRKCVLDAVRKTKGKGCPPYVLGIGIGAADDQVSVLAGQQLFRRLNDSSEYPAIGELERNLLDEINRLGNGAEGFDGKTVALGVKIGVNHRHTSSYCVSVFVSCWASRRARLIW
ncbi:MAG TPA: fumarate hydratase [Nitrospiraceae bacterium]|nr:fumarate hydratase [Nitrospiraceae bacterium]